MITNTWMIKHNFCFNFEEWTYSKTNESICNANKVKTPKFHSASYPIASYHRTQTYLNGNFLRCFYFTDFRKRINKVTRREGICSDEVESVRTGLVKMA